MIGKARTRINVFLELKRKTYREGLKKLEEQQHRKVKLERRTKKLAV
jgi:hypothetical protein